MMNKTLLIGRLGSDPEVRHTASGKAVTSISVATTKTWKDQQTGERKEKTQWHRCTFFGRLAEVAGQYLRKGSLVYLEGELEYGKYTAQDGTERYTTDIIVQNMQMLGGGNDRGQYKQESPRDDFNQASEPDFSGFDDPSFSDDVPF